MGLAYDEWGRIILIGLTLAAILGAAGFVLHDGGEKGYLRDLCKEYAGFDFAKRFMSGEPSAKGLLEGLRKQDRKLLKRAADLVDDLNCHGVKVPTFLEDAQRLFPKFLAKKLARNLDKITKDEVKKILKALKSDLPDLEGNPDIAGQLRTWCNEAADWIRVVDRLGSEIARDVRMEKDEGMFK